MVARPGTVLAGTSHVPMGALKMVGVVVADEAVVVAEVAAMSARPRDSANVLTPKASQWPRT